MNLSSDDCSGNGTTAVILNGSFLTLASPHPSPSTNAADSDSHCFTDEHSNNSNNLVGNAEPPINVVDTINSVTLHDNEKTHSVHDDATPLVNCVSANVSNAVHKNLTGHNDVFEEAIQQSASQLITVSPTTNNLMIDGAGNTQVHNIDHETSSLLDIVQHTNSNDNVSAITDVQDTSNVTMTRDLLRLTAGGRLICIQDCSLVDSSNLADFSNQSDEGGFLVTDDNSLINTETGELFKFEVGTVTLGETPKNTDECITLIDSSTQNVINTEDTGKLSRTKGGWPKGRKRKNLENVIKGPVSAYTLFATKRRREIYKEDPSCMFSEVTRILGREWSQMDKDQKEEYLRRAQCNKETFKKQLKEKNDSSLYQSVLKRKKMDHESRLGEIIILEEKRADGKGGTAAFASIEEALHCRICDKVFSSAHNKREHLMGKSHLTQLQMELQKEKKEEDGDEATDANGIDNRVSPYISPDINTFVEEFMHRNMNRELELDTLKQTFQNLKGKEEELKESIEACEESKRRLEEDIQSNKQWAAHLHRHIDNLRMVPTLFGVINF